MSSVHTVSRGVVFTLAALMTVLSSGGLVLGFGPVYMRLADELQWHALCPANSTAVCPSQEVQLQNVFTTGFLGLVLGQTVFGICLDVVGPRYTTVLSAIVAIAGNVCMATGDARQGTGGLITAGYGLIAFGGMGVLFASLQLAELFAAPSVYCGLLVAAFYASGYVYVLLGTSISRATFFYGSAIVTGVCALGGYALFPIRHVSTEAARVAVPGLAFERPLTDVAKFKYLWAEYKLQLRRRDFWVFVCVGSFLTLINVFAGGAVPNIVKQLEPRDVSLQSTYTNYLYPLVSNSSFVFAPFTGWIIERRGFRKAAVVTVVEFGMLCGSMMLPSLRAQILSFALLAIAVGSLTAIQYSYIMKCFPSKLYGLLSGTVTIVVFVFCLLNYALTPLAQNTFDGNNNYVFLILLVPTVGTLGLIRYLRDEPDADDKRTALLEPGADLADP
ncbi:hypothetical protein ACHHYP_09813 [Achlya hypogyna]|uniref:Major Facilitator Superfamily (MFS) n=1 Tax=Achlya hypogyna TaxID=1202772 RepID=A0A1V9YMG9_ACHHY|nr:hypothetical protein ACHHYP_09813 [Achlya hypogyna]